ncbi:RagB/SusD family nutrient uptake outer membrane protein [Pedobacter sp. Hv1]|uniref:RagB/SusD family nutrient uptake outer membrane protein n=1 Tax=Pedobacter sp. Hv1 TaxID=1740090 RepID=UPI0006D8C2D5|nr:RagB/SusD family nutrient uptake outer membrane protein [Pedobacter sp. Hv1]KQC02499.1 hypothetical protein AQF98_02680 [Pedobacter sp. Hv1]
MKTYIYKIFAVLLIVSTVSCKKSFLDRVPSDFINESEVFGNIDNAEGFLNNTYSGIPTWRYGAGHAYVSAAMTDEAYQLWSDGAILFNTGAWNPSNFLPVSDEWGNTYSRIRAINIFLTNFDKIPEDPNVPGRKARMKGEALLLRGFYHSILFRGWGKIPLMDQPLSPATDGDAVFLKRSEYAEVMDFIIKDLDAGMALLPPKHSAGLWGRVTKTIGLAIKSRLYLYYASPLLNPANDQARWQKAAQASKEALDMALAEGYVLEPNYADAFLKYANSECIWGRNIGTGAVDGIDQVMQTLGHAGWSNCGPVQSFVDAYQMKNGLPITDPASGWDPKHPYTNRDPRLNATVLYPGARWKGRTINIYGQDRPSTIQPGTHYWWRKYLTESLNLNNNTGGVTKAFSIYRTGELYLNYAEAQNEVAGPDGTVYAAINAIRKRAGMPDIPAGLSKDQMRDAMRQERRIELAFEGHRFWDVRRWKIAEVVDNKPVYGVNYTLSATNPTDTTFTYFEMQKRTFDPRKHYFMPIPQPEIDKLVGKNPGFKQTEGW